MCDSYSLMVNSFLNQVSRVVLSHFNDCFVKSLLDFRTFFGQPINPSQLIPRCDRDYTGAAWLRPKKNRWVVSPLGGYHVGESHRDVTCQIFPESDGEFRLAVFISKINGHEENPNGDSVQSGCKHCCTAFQSCHTS